MQGLGSPSRVVVDNDAADQRTRYRVLIERYDQSIHTIGTEGPDLRTALLELIAEAERRGWYRQAPG